MKFEHVHFGFLILTVIFCVYAIVHVGNTTTQACEDYSRVVEAMDINMSEFNVNGFYHNNKGFYCVITDDRSEEEIKETATHEKCHALVDKNKEHFCGAE